MQLLCDLHTHSRFSRATSQKLTVGNIAAVCQTKGVDVIGTGDATHPIWLRELRQNLQEKEPGLYVFPKNPDVRFLLSGEISLMYKHNDRSRRNHLLILLPNFEVATKVQEKFHKIGNITSDGRPILGLTSRDLTEMLLEIDSEILVIPAHVWTPWFSTFGSKSGYDSLKECFEDMTPHIRAVESGLSADPAMCWRVSELDEINIISNGDAHSPGKIMREATMLEVAEPSFSNIRSALICPIGQIGPNHIESTIEFFPEEGKYHWSGHAKCQIVQSAKQTKKLGTNCPVCGRSMILGVEWRSEELSARSVEELKIINKDGWTHSQLFPSRPPYHPLIPLDEIIAETVGVKSVTSAKVLDQYYQMTQTWPEIKILLDMPIADIEKKFDDRLAEAIIFGKINIWRNTENPQKIIDPTQSSLFSS
ncbi:MAG: hypothetical protein UT11_C0022G0005 [Berkelbacteria bacterium GW2011_GWA2_38_9]|uniref:DNA helicase UvrD n=1 Tax=Berkelbacteria bacterium GW2011_GWA2_38_9 TaxID=1618334 RepID=A0A0G0LF01_9BACT|nr:MAG: hypothetical protein UT11_C0022G0005 [Berkelbacteria bacterium GW2011_GWA2_38_9]